MDLKTAIASLDPAQEEHWTNDGMPRIDVLANMTGDKTLKRQDITNAAPELTRESAQKGKDDDGDASPSADGPQDGPGQDARAPTDVGDDERKLDADDELGSETAPVDYLSMTWSDLVTVENLEGFIAAVNDEAVRLTKIMNDAKARLDAISRTSDRAHRRLVHLKRLSKTKGADPIRDYIDQQNKARAEKAQKAAAFIKAGTTAQDVVDHLSIKAPIDRAMNQRKPKPGSTRPNPRMPVQRGSVMND